MDELTFAKKHNLKIKPHPSLYFKKYKYCLTLVNCSDHFRHSDDTALRQYLKDHDSKMRQELFRKFQPKPASIDKYTRIYTNDIDVLQEVAEDIIEANKTADGKTTLNEFKVAETIEKNVKLCNRLPWEKYKYKVVFALKSHDEVERIAAIYEDYTRFAHHEHYAEKYKYYYQNYQQPALYIEDEGILTMFQLALSNHITRITTYVIREKKKA